MTQPIPRIITLQALTSLHPGTGQTTGVVDLPIQREVHSGHPMYASSGLKGSLRDKAEQKCNGGDKGWIYSLFGKEADESGARAAAGALAVTDGRILAFPVRSLQKVFVWVTCPMVIKRFHRDAQLVGLPPADLPELNPSPGENEVWVARDAYFSDPLVLEELTFTTKTDQEETRKKIAASIIKILTDDGGFDPDRLVIIPDEDFSYLVEHATQVSARIKLNKRKTTTGDGGNLWYEETLPPETILYGFILCHTPRHKIDGLSSSKDVAVLMQELVDDHYLQIGGNETVGQGWCYVNLYGGAE